MLYQSSVYRFYVKHADVKKQKKKTLLNSSIVSIFCRSIVFISLSLEMLYKIWFTVKC